MLVFGCCVECNIALIKFSFGQYHIVTVWVSNVQSKTYAMSINRRFRYYCIVYQEIETFWWKCVIMRKQLNSNKILIGTTSSSLVPNLPADFAWIRSLIESYWNYPNECFSWQWICIALITKFSAFSTIDLTHAIILINLVLFPRLLLSGENRK